MLIYFITFILAFIFSFLSQKYDKNNKFIMLLLSIIAITIPSILAALRMSSVGSDTSTYSNLIFKRIINCNNINDIKTNIVNGLNIEFLYGLLIFIISRFTTNIHIFYFVVEFIILSFIYKTSYDNKNINKNYSIIYLLFLLLFYNKSLNIMRQAIAISIFVYSVKYVYKRNLLKYLFLILIATGFHTTAIVAIFVYPIINIIEGKYKSLKKIFLLLLFVLLILNLKNVINIFIINLGILNKKYLDYFNNESGKIISLDYISMFVILLYYIIFEKNKNIINNNIYIFTIGILLYSLGFYANWLWRIGYYYYYLLPIIISGFKTKYIDKKKSIPIISIFIIICFIYSYLYYGYFNLDKTVPYYGLFNIQHY